MSSRLEQQVADPPGSREAEYAASYHAVLASNPALAQQTFAALLEAHRAHNLMFQDRMLCNVLRPRFMTPARLDELSRVSGILAGVFERAGQLALQSEAALAALGADEMEREIWSVDPGYPGFTLTSRLDSFMVGREPRFVEYNAESPAGIGFTDRLSEIFLDLPGMRRWDHTARLDRFHGRRHLFETLLWAFHQWGGAGMPTIAVIDWENVMTRRDFELCAEYFRDQGSVTVICDPRRLEYRDGRLWLGDRAISLVYRRVLLHELLERADEAHGLLQAYRDGAVCMVNSPRSKLLHKKSMFALLTDRQLGLALTEEEEDVINATVPWTRIAAEGPTTYGGRRVDLVQFVLAEQERLVLKPFDDYGGKGVVLGWEVTPEEWRGALEAAVNSRYVVQERVPIPCAEFPFWQGGGPSGGSGSVAVAPLLLDTDPLLFRGRLGSVLTRISGSALLNVSAGTGSTTPTFVVEERG